MAARRKRPSPKLDKAKALIRGMVSRGAQRSKLVHARVRSAGISTRTYRTARKQLRTMAIRRSKQQHRRGTGTWYVKGR